MKAEKYKKILMRYDQAFKKINPSFEIYQYSLMDVDWVSRRVLDEEDIKECNDIVGRKVKLDQLER